MLLFVSVEKITKLIEKWFQHMKLQWALNGVRLQRIIL